MSEIKIEDVKFQPIPERESKYTWGVTGYLLIIIYREEHLCVIAIVDMSSK
jgi:hypothetical protein